MHSEIIIVGAGLTGLPLAIACAGAGLPTVLIDRNPLESSIVDWRTTAIADGSRRILETVGVWPHLAALAQPILDIRVADKGSSLFLHYDHRSVGDTPLGWIVENHEFRRALNTTAGQLPNLTIIAPATIEAAVRGEDRVSVSLEDGRVATGRLLVAADGKASRLRDEADIRTMRHAYSQQSLIATVAHQRPHGGVAVEHFLPQGPFAILPMQGNRSSIVWTERADRVTALLSLDEAAFDAEIARLFGSWLGPVKAVGPRAAYPLEIMLALRTTAPRLALVGESAHVVHPIAGQGWNLGLRDVATLAELLVDRCRLGLDPGAADLLHAYEGRRRADTLALLAATDGLNRIFSNDLGPFKLGRRLGLAAVDHAPPIKRFFMRHAMGLAGQLPRLARNERL